MRGTYLNTATVAVGAAVGLEVGSVVPLVYKTVALEGLGLVTALIGVRMFFQTKNAVISVAAIALGGILGALIGIPAMLDCFAEWCRHELGAAGRFNEGLITSAVLFCVGPMTILGCLQDGIEDKIDLLTIKSALDGISAFFLAATLGVGVLVTAAVVFAVQGTITLAARRLKNFAADDEYIAEASAVGGAILLGIGLGLLNIKNMRMETYLPAIVLAPALVLAGRKFAAGRRV